MITLLIKAKEFYDSTNNVFYNSPEKELRLEHSLLSISKWESIWEKPFLTSEKKTIDQSRSYVQCMTITPNVDELTYYAITETDMDLINKYIEKTMSATTFGETKETRTGRTQVVTSELIYYWMIAFNIPFECEKWHLNRLLTLINICDVKSKSNQKVSRKDLLARNRELNAARRAKLNTRG